MRILMVLIAALLLVSAHAITTRAQTARRGARGPDADDAGERNGQSVDRASERPPDVDSDVWAHVQRMTLEQRIGQMTQINIDAVLSLPQPSANGSTDALTPDHVRSVNLTAVRDMIARFHVGSWLNSPLAARSVAGYSGLDVEEWRALIDTLERESVASGDVPPIYGIDSVHGANYIRGATLFPHQINAGASFNVSLVERMGAVTAKDTRAAGITWNFAPILDVAVQPTWPRVFETFGECPFVVSTMGAALIRGLQGVTADGTPDLANLTKVAATFKHFVAYGAPRDGHDRSDCWVPERQMREYFLPPFEAALRAQVATGMLAYADVNGIPMTSNARWTVDLLRGSMGFNGTLVTDFNEVANLHEWHHVAASLEDAARIALASSSTDMAMVPDRVEKWFDSVVELVRAGTIPASRIDGACARVLQLKKRLGLVKSYKELDEASKAASKSSSSSASSSSSSKPNAKAKADAIAPGVKQRKEEEEPKKKQTSTPSSPSDSSEDPAPRKRTREERRIMESVGSEEDQGAALQLARESLVLLENDGTLPVLLASTPLYSSSSDDNKPRLRSGALVRRVLVVGPTGDSLVRQTGGWTFHWQGASSEDEFESRVGDTVYRAIKALAKRLRSDVEVSYEPGVNIDGSHSAEQLESALRAARQADLVVACVGEETYAEKPGDIPALPLPWGQQNLVNQLTSLPEREEGDTKDSEAHKSGYSHSGSNATKGEEKEESRTTLHNKKVVLVLLQGRPRTLDSLDLSRVRAVIHAGLPGPQGGPALAETLFGLVSPSARLPLTYPRQSGEAPVQYWHKWSQARNYRPQWEFGAGMSYTKFTYSSLHLSSSEADIDLDRDSKLRVQVAVRNDGTVAGQEPLLLFVSDLYRSVSPEVKRLRAFTKLHLKPGEERTVSFELRWADLSFIDAALQRRTEKGDFIIQIGELSAPFLLTKGRVGCARIGPGSSGSSGDDDDGQSKCEEGDREAGSSGTGAVFELGAAARQRVDRWWSMIQEESLRQEREVEEYHAEGEAAAAEAAKAAAEARARADEDASSSTGASGSDSSSSSAKYSILASTASGPQVTGGDRSSFSPDKGKDRDRDAKPEKEEEEEEETRGGRAGAGRAGAASGSSASSFATVFACAFSAIVGACLTYAVLRCTGAVGGTGRGGDAASAPSGDSESERFLSSNEAFASGLDGRRPTSYQSI